MKLVVALYLVSLLPFSLVGLYRLWMLVRFSRVARRPAPAPPLPARDELPCVTVQVPLYDERFVAGRVIRAVAGLDYPHDRLEIQILDDSTDDTSAVVQRVAAALPPTLRFHHLRREVRDGYKAGALAAGLARARGELVAIFDADFVPPADFLQRTVGHFRDPCVGMVQTRWSFLDDERSLLAHAQVALLHAHFGVEHPVRHASGLFFNFNGTAGVWRRDAIEDAGGWRSDSLTEDLDLSYRAQLRGWRFVYRGDVVCPSELPPDVRAFRAQQYRWSKGMSEVARRVLPEVWRASLPPRVKVDATFHLLSNLGYPLVGLMSLTLVPTFFVYGPELSQRPHFQALSAFFTVTNLVVVIAFLVVGDGASTGRWRRALGRAVALLPIGVATAVAGAEGAARGLLGHASEFVRTPKNDAASPRGAGPAGYRSPTSATALVELGLGLYHLVWMVVILHSGRIDLVPLSLIFLVGYGVFASLEIEAFLALRARTGPLGRLARSGRRDRLPAGAGSRGGG